MSEVTRIIIDGKKLKKFRQSLALSQEEFANRVGMSKTNLSALENDVRGITYSPFRQMAKLAGKSIEEMQTILGPHAEGSLRVEDRRAEQTDPIGHIALVSGDHPAPRGTDIVVRFKDGDSLKRALDAVLERMKGNVPPGGAPVAGDQSPGTVSRKKGTEK